MKRRTTIVAALLVAIAAWCMWSLEFQAARLERAPAAVAQLIGEAWPPELGQDGDFLLAVFRGLLETLQIAFLSTLFGTALGLPLALLAARNLAPGAVVAMARVASATLRVFPSLLWAILAVLVFGLGPLAGTIAMTLYTIGFVSKLQYEALEGVTRDALDAARAMGASRFQQVWLIAVPESGNAMRSQLLFMFDYNLRASSIVGFVGAGGLGQLLYIHFRFFDYGHVMTILFVMFFAVGLLDIISLWLRRRFIEVPDGPSRRPRWRDLIMPHV